MNKPLVSIVLPSLRPSQLAQCLASIHRYTVGIEYEVVVVSPFDIEPHPNVVHVKEARSEGVYKAVASGYERAKGEYIIHIPDDCRATPLWAANMIAFMRPHDDEIFEGSFRFFNVKGERPEPGIYNYGKLIAPFLCIRRDEVTRIGGLMNCCYKSFWGDPDLSLRVWHNGGRVETCPNAWIYYPDRDDKIYENSYKSYFIHDREAFIRRWHHIYAQSGKSLSSTQPIRKQGLSPKLPPEKCAELYVSMQRRDWKTVRKVLMSEDTDACVYPEGFQVLYDCVVKRLRSPLNPKKTLYSVLEWLWGKGYAPSPSDIKLEEKLLLHQQIWSGAIDVAGRIITVTRTGKLISKIVPNFVKRRLLNRG